MSSLLENCDKRYFKSHFLGDPQQGLSASRTSVDDDSMAFVDCVEVVVVVVGPDVSSPDMFCNVRFCPTPVGKIKSAVGVAKWRVQYFPPGPG